MIVGLSGVAGSGKDTVADVLVRERGFVKVSFADPLKRIARDVYAFTREQLWGPSSARNAPDPRYPKTSRARAWRDRMLEEIGLPMYALDERWSSAIANEFGSNAAGHFLAPREACQRLGTEWGRECYPPTWFELGLRTALRLLNPVPGDLQGRPAYNAERGLHALPFGAFVRPSGVVIPDARFENELVAIQHARGRAIRITRPNAGLAGSAATHLSEKEQEGIPSTDFDAVIVNDGSLDDLRARVLAVVDAFGDSP